MKSKAKPDKEIHIRKKVAGGTTGAVLGAMVGGPVGALVGGVVGTVVGGAVETGRLQTFVHSSPVTNKAVAKGRSATKRLIKKARPGVKAARVTTRSKARASRPKRKARNG